MFYENRLLRLTPEEQRKLDEETQRVKTQTVAPARETKAPTVGLSAGGITTPTIFEGGPTLSAFDAVIEDAETPPEPAAPPPPETPLSYEDWKASDATAAGGYAGYVENYKPPEAEAAPPIEAPPVTAPSPTEFQPDDNLYEQNRKTNADNAARAASNPDYTYTPLPENPQEEMNMQLGEQAVEVAYQNAQNEIATELEDLGIKKVGESVLRSIASARAQYMQGRSGGVYSSSKAKVPNAVANSANRMLTEAKLNIQSARNRRDYYEKQLAKSHADQNTKMLKYFKKQVAVENARILAYQKAAEADALSIEEGMAAAVSKEKEEAMAKIDILSGSPSTAAAMSVGDFETLAIQAGFTESAANAFAESTITKAKALLEAQKSKDVEAVRVAELNYQKGLKALENPIVEKIEGYQKLKGALDSGAINQEAFDALSVELGYAEAELSPLETALKLAEVEYKQAQTAGQRATARAKLSELNDYKAYTATNKDIIGMLGNLGESMHTDEAYAAAGITRIGGQEFYGECAAFTNDMLGNLRYGSSLKSKTDNINNEDPLNPTTGSVFVSNLGPNGHCGFVESVDLENRTATLYDMNRMGAKQASRRVVGFDELVSQEGIVGYENLAMTAKKNGGEAGKDPSTLLSQIQQQNLQTAGFSADKTTVYGDLDPIRQIVARNNIRTETGAKAVVIGILKQAMVDGLETREDAQALVEIYQSLGFGDKTITSLFNQLNAKGTVPFTFQNGKLSK